MNKSATAPVETSTAANRYLEFMRGMDDLTNAAADIPVIDHDFAPPTAKQPGSAVSYGRMIDNFTETLGDDPDSRLIGLNLRAAKLAVRAVARDLEIGRNIDYFDFVESTLGIRPALVPETSDDDSVESIAGLQRQVADVVRELGFRFDPADRDKFNARYAIPSDEMQPTIEGLVGEAKDFMAGIMGQRMIKGLDKVDVKVAPMEGTYQAHFGTDGRGNFRALFNTNPLLKFSSLEELAAMVHEFTHALSSTTRQQLVDQAKLTPAAAVLPVFSPMYFQEEVAARAMENRLLAEKTQADPYAKYVYLATKLFNAVANNMIIMANTGHSPEEVAEYGKARLPFDEPGKLDKSAELFEENLAYKTLFVVDVEAIRIGEAIARLPKKEMKAVITRFCSEIIPTEEILAYAK